MSVSATFKAAAVEYGAALLKSAQKDEVKRHAVMTLVAIGFLSKMTWKEINITGREVSGATEDTWNTGKTIFSQAKRSLDDSPGKYGAGELLAKMWAAKDFTVSLDKAYELSSGPKSEVDIVTSLSKKLATLSSEQVQEILSRYVEICELHAYAHNDIQALVKVNLEQVLSVSKAA